MAVEERLHSPHRGFPAWLGTRGLSPEIALAMDTELGIRDYEVLLACAEDLQVRSELFSVARERLPFGFYAVLRRVVAAFPAERVGDCGAAASGRSCPGLGSLLEALVNTLSSLSRELLRSANKLSALDLGTPRDGDGVADSGGADGSGDGEAPGQRQRQRQQRGGTHRYSDVADHGTEEVCEMPAEEVDDHDDDGEEEEEDVEVPSGWRVNQMTETSYPKLPADSAQGPLLRMSEMLTSASSATSPAVVEVGGSELEASQVVVKAEAVDEGGWGREPERIWNPASALYVQQQQQVVADIKPVANVRRIPAPARNPARSGDRPLSHPYPLSARELGETGGTHHHHRPVIAARPGAPDWRPGLRRRCRRRVERAARAGARRRRRLRRRQRRRRRRRVRPQREPLRGVRQGVFDAVVPDDPPAHAHGRAAVQLRVLRALVRAPGGAHQPPEAPHGREALHVQAQRRICTGAIASGSKRRCYAFPGFQARHT
ncbi:uncharacterized protein LOC133350686 [Lethenteron reissneri]|uniref:uncharacterized protein LOC133350686 n=1 Tax=Lethenteron reissneri TaxID=7753 RepID=UPI002AB742AA|nr:uncharacterized protein LOC133350686 [Lethenteron reissneri]